MKYLIFACYTHYPSGGMADLKVTRETRQDAEAYVEELKNDSDYNFVQIYCVDEKEVIQYSYTSKGTIVRECKVTEQGIERK